MSEPLPLEDGVKLLRNWFTQRAKRCRELGHPEDAGRYESYLAILERLAEKAGVK